VKHHPLHAGIAERARFSRTASAGQKAERAWCRSSVGGPPSQQCLDHVVGQRAIEVGPRRRHRRWRRPQIASGLAEPFLDLCQRSLG
jgi:hypothetical protein